jgi:hypothetical protein
MRSLAVSILLAMCLNSAQTDSRASGEVPFHKPPPRIEWPESKVDGIVIQKLSVSGFPIVLDHTSLVEARIRLGGVLGSAGDAGDAKSWLCFRGADAKGPWLFWLTSVEINGAAIGGFIWKRINPKAPVEPNCPLLRGQNPIKLQLDLRLGTTKSHVLRLLGAPSMVRDQELFYMHEREETIEGTTYTISNGFEVMVRDGVVVQIAAVEYSSS